MQILASLDAVFTPPWQYIQLFIFQVTTRPRKATICDENVIVETLRAKKKLIPLASKIQGDMVHMVIHRGVRLSFTLVQKGRINLLNTPHPVPSSAMAGLRSQAKWFVFSAVCVWNDDSLVALP
jgi:hypothetical protein